MEVRRPEHQPPALAVDTDTWRAAFASSPGPDPRSLRVITWNVWFDPFFFDERFEALIAIVLGKSPDVACFQEVTPRFAAAVRTSSIIAEAYDVSTNDVAPYGCMVLVRTELRASFQQVDFEETMMSRSLLVAELNPVATDIAWKKGVVGTVHLESLNSAIIRRLQLAACVRELEGHRNAILCGDFNFDDTQVT